MRCGLASLALLMAPALAGDEEWVEVARSPALIVSLKKNSGEFKKNRSGVEVYAAHARMHWTASQTINVYQAYVTKDDCDAGYGKLVFVTLAGEYSFETEWSSGSGNIAAAEADVLCYAWRQRNTKGL